MDTDVATMPVLSQAREIADLARGMADDIDACAAPSANHSMT